MEEELDADPAVLGLPDQVREEQHHRDRHRQRKPRRTQQVTTPHTKRRQQQDHDDRERVLGLQPHADGQPEQRPRPPSKRQPQRKPQHHHGRELVEGDRLEQPVGRDQDRREPHRHRRQGLGTASAAEVPRHQRRDNDRRRTGQDRKGAEPDQRPAEQDPRQRRQPRRHRRELDIAALQVAAGDRVIQLVALPAVPASDREMERALGGHHDQHRPDRQRAQLGTGTTRTRRAFLPPPPRRERRSRAGDPHLISLEPTGPCVKAADGDTPSGLVRGLGHASESS
jgi:hypothetical protein